jgi:hypothetical protein
LRRAALIKEKIERLQKQLVYLDVFTAPQIKAGLHKRRIVSAATRAKMAAAHKARWAKFAKKKPVKSGTNSTGPKFR